MKWALCDIHLHASSVLIEYAAKPSMARSSPQDQDTSYVRCSVYLNIIPLLWTIGPKSVRQTI